MAQRFRFTLIELLIVIAIVAIMSAILLPALAKSRGSAKGILCKNQERQHHTGFISYVNDYNEYLPTAYSAGMGFWAQQLNPYLGNVPLQDYYGKTIFKCPWEPKQYNNYAMSYAYNSHLGNYNADYSPKSGRINAVKTPSICIATGCVRNGLTEAYTTPYSLGSSYFEVSIFGWGHSNGANYLFVDGHAQYYKIHKLTWSYLFVSYGSKAEAY